MDLESLRKNYRLKLGNDRGIAIFDLTSAFLGAYILQEKFHLAEMIPVKDSEKIKLYYLLVLPFAVLCHYYFKIDSFLTRELQSPSTNHYKNIFIVICLLILKSCMAQ